MSITVRDGASVDATDTFTWTVTNTNQLPTATGATGSTTTNEDTPLGLTLRGTDPETCNLTFNVPATTTHGTLSAPTAIACAAGSPNSDTTGVTYTPAANYNGPDSFSYTVTDGSTGTSSPVTVNLTVTAVNDLPTATPGSAVTTTGSPVVISLAGSDRETCELTFSTPATTVQGGTLSATTPVACVAGSPNTDTASLTYTPPAAYSGPDSFTFTVNDGTAPSAPATISITVGPGGGSTTTTFPVAADAQVYSSQPTTNYGTITTMRTREGTGASSSPIYRSYVRFDISGLSGSVSDVKLRLWVTDASSDQQQVLAVTPDSWVESGAGSLTYNNGPTIDPPGTPLGSAPAPATGAWVVIDLANSAVSGNGSVSFLIRSAGTNSAIFNTKEAATNRPELVVTYGSGPANTLPSATGATGSTTTDEDTPLGLTLRGTDPETCNLTFNVPATTTHGTLSAPSAIACVAGSPNSDTAGVTYTPAANYNGPDSFSYTVTDGSTGTSSPVTVNLTVSAVNDLPTATAGTAVTTTGSPVVISLAGSDRETCELTFSTPATTVQGGTLSATTPVACVAGSPNTDTASLTYTPPAAYSGPDSFTFTVNDGTAPSAPATISITVGPGGGSTTTTFPVAADAQVYSSQPTTNYGTLNSMRTREGTGASSSPIYRSYVRFDISGLSGPVSDVKLRLWVTDASPNPQQVFAVSPDTWIESGTGSLTYNNAPTIDPPGSPLGGAPGAGRRGVGRDRPRQQRAQRQRPGQLPHQERRHQQRHLQHQGGRHQPAPAGGHLWLGFRQHAPDRDRRDRLDDDQRGHPARADPARDRPRDLQPDLQRAGHDDPRHAQRGDGQRLRRGQPQQRHGRPDLYPGRQLLRARQLQLHGHRRGHRDVQPGHRQPDRDRRQRSAHRHARLGQHDDRQPGRHQPGRDRPRDVRADVHHAGHHGPGRDPRRDQPAGLCGGQPQHRHGQPDLHPAGRLQRPRQLHLHGQRRDRALGRRRRSRSPSGPAAGARPRPSRWPPMRRSIRASPRPTTGRSTRCAPGRARAPRAAPSTGATCASTSAA